MIITGTGSLDRDMDNEKGRVTIRDRIFDWDMDRKKDESCMIITGTGSLTGTWTGKR
jgi:hypothetical protein